MLGFHHDAYLHDHYGELGHHVGQPVERNILFDDRLERENLIDNLHDLGGGDASHPAALKEAFLPLDDERQGCQSDGHKVGDGENHTRRHKFRESRLVGAVDGILESNGHGS